MSGTFPSGWVCTFSKAFRLLHTPTERQSLICHTAHRCGSVLTVFTSQNYIPVHSIAQRPLLLHAVLQFQFPLKGSCSAITYIKYQIEREYMCSCAAVPQIYFSFTLLHKMLLFSATESFRCFIPQLITPSSLLGSEKWSAFFQEILHLLQHWMKTLLDAGQALTVFNGLGLLTAGS